MLKNDPSTTDPLRVCSRLKNGRLVFRTMRLGPLFPTLVFVSDGVQVCIDRKGHRSLSGCGTLVWIVVFVSWHEVRGLLHVPSFPFGSSRLARRLHLACSRRVITWKFLKDVSLDKLISSAVVPHGVGSCGPLNPASKEHLPLRLTFGRVFVVRFVM